MDWLKADLMPRACQDCQEDDCYNCDYALEVWYLTREEELKLRRKGLEKAVERLQQKIQEIDKELRGLCVRG